MKQATNLKMLIAMLVLSAAAVMGFAACGSNNSSAAAVPVPALGSGLNPYNCPTGSLYSQTYGCLTQGSCPAGEGYTTSTNPPQCVPGTVVTSTGIGGSYEYVGVLSVQNQQQFDLLMQYAGQCNPYWSGVNYGSYNCDSYTNSGYVAIQFSGAIPGPNQTASGAMMIGAGGIYGGAGISFTSQAAAVLYNNSAGMQIVGTLNGSDQGLRLIVNNGLIGQTTSMTATLRYQNVTIGTVNLVPR